MWSLVGVTAAGIAIALWEAPTLWRRRRWREAVCFLVLLCAGITLSFAEAMQWTIANPLDAISFVFKPVSDAMEQLLQ